jgi:hypothetical protein
MDYLPIIVSCVFLLFCVMISYVLKVSYPKEINSWIGYRTRRSIRSQESWVAANECAGKLLFRYALVAILVFPIVLATFIALDIPFLFLMPATAGLWAIALIATIIQTERRLIKLGH